MISSIQDFYGFNVFESLYLNVLRILIKLNTKLKHSCKISWINRLYDVISWYNITNTIQKVGNRVINLAFMRSIVCSSIFNNCKKMPDFVKKMIMRWSIRWNLGFMFYSRICTTNGFSFVLSFITCHNLQYGLSLYSHHPSRDRMTLKASPSPTLLHLTGMSDTVAAIPPRSRRIVA